MEEGHPLGIVQAVGLAVGMSNAEKTEQQLDLEHRMHAAVVTGQALGENDEQIKARIDAVLRG